MIMIKLSKAVISASVPMSKIPEELTNVIVQKIQIQLRDLDNFVIVTKYQSIRSQRVYNELHLCQFENLIVTNFEPHIEIL